MTEKIVVDKPKLKFCQTRKEKCDSLRFTLYDKVAPQLCISVSVNGWNSLMHNFKMNGNFSKYLSLTNPFRLKINYYDSLSAI